MTKLFIEFLQKLKPQLVNFEKRIRKLEYDLFNLHGEQINNALLLEELKSKSSCSEKQIRNMVEKLSYLGFDYDNLEQKIRKLEKNKNE